MIELFRELNEEQQITVILVTHDPWVARQAQRNIVLRDGRIVIDTTDPEEAIQSLQRSQPFLAQSVPANDGDE